MEPGGGRRETPVRFALEGERLFVRARRDLAIRIWESPRIRVTPCRLSAQRADPGLEGVGRVLADEDELAAASAFAVRGGLRERMRLRLMRWLGVESLYVELARKP